MENKNTSISFDCISKHRSVLMGLAIIGILIFHYTEDCVNYAYNLNSLVVSYKKYVGSSGVDVFLFLSGLGLYYSYTKNPNKWDFYKKRFLRLMIPYFLVAIPSWFYKDFIYTNLGVVQFVKDVLFISFFDGGEIWFWYILFMLICYLLFPYVYDYIDSPGSKNKMGNIFVFVTVVGIMLQLYNPTFFARANIALLRFPAFFLGCFVGKASYKKKPMKMEYYLLCILALIVLPLVNTSGLFLNRYLWGAGGIAAFVLIAVGLEVLERKNVKLTIIKKIVEWFGKYSLELYLTHVAVRYIMQWNNLPTYRVRYECVLLILSILASIVLKKLTNIITR